MSAINASSWGVAPRPSAGTAGSLGVMYPAQDVPVTPPVTPPTYPVQDWSAGGGASYGRLTARDAAERERILALRLDDDEALILL